MNSNTALIEKFYSAFQQKDFRAMQQCYHDDVLFSDPVFPLLRGKQAKAMWHMLVSGGKDLGLIYSQVQAGDKDGSCHWEATYTFSVTGRKVRNIIDAQFEFKDGKIIRHADQFNLWKWSRMALGPSGTFLGWSPLVKNKIRRLAAGNLQKFIDAHQEYQ